MPAGRPTKLEHGTPNPVAFSSAAKMGTWLNLRNGENYWYVRLLDHEAITDVLRELYSKGYREIYADIDDVIPGESIPIADFVVRLTRLADAEAEAQPSKTSVG
jgi:hypothetical protein